MRPSSGTKSARAIPVDRRAVERLYAPLAVVCAAGVALRVLVMVTYASAVFVFQNGDSIRYARIAAPGFHSALFSDPTAPAGYPALLKLLRAVWSALPFTIGVQHALGVVTALVLYALTRRLGASRGVAVIPAAVVLLSGDQLFLEHALLTETVWGLLLSAGLYAMLRGAAGDDDGGPSWRWLALGGTLLAAAMLVRQLSFVVLLVAVVWAAIVVRNSVGVRLRAVFAVAAPALVVLGLYSGVARLEHGSAGLGGLVGYQLYGRVAEFANCADFHPPGRTRLLCQSIPPAERPGPTAYLFNPALPLLGRFRVRTPRDEGVLLSFSLDAIENQPGAYLGAVAADWERAAGLRSERRGEGASASIMNFGRRVPYGAPATTAQGVAAYYKRVYTSVRPLPLDDWGARLGSYQSLVRLHDWLVIPLLLIALAGVLRAPGPQRARIALVTTCALALYVVPPILALWDVRYGVQPGELLTAAAAAGGWAVFVRRRGGGDARDELSSQLSVPTASQM